MRFWAISVCLSRFWPGYFVKGGRKVVPGQRWQGAVSNGAVSIVVLWDPVHLYRHRARGQRSQRAAWGRITAILHEMSGLALFCIKPRLPMGGGVFLILFLATLHEISGAARKASAEHNRVCLLSCPLVAKPLFCEEQSDVLLYDLKVCIVMMVCAGFLPSCYD
uniref:Uncharacterized protein n=1 Tax=Magnetococcus massalia (strain MO-1) TaxID=451514 RepID=A0A1S7LIA1_MAGMO|nr:protein of unknown function [Candidatus Magnetococcus massalia]